MVGDDVAQCLGNEAVTAVRAIVGAHDDLAAGTQLRLKDDPFARTAADDAGHAHPGPTQLLGDGQHHCGADTTADARGATCLDQLGRLAQWADHVADCAADLERDEVLRTLADGLDYERDRALLRVRVGNRQRYPFGAFCRAHDHELARLADLGDPRRVDDQTRDVG